MRFALCLVVSALSMAVPANAAEWRVIDVHALQAFADDDIARHRSKTGNFEAINVSEVRFSENGFDWHLLRFANEEKPDGPLWVVPHDDEDAAFDAMIAGLYRHGGTGIVVNTAQGRRRQAGGGLCGVRVSVATACDPNRNFDARTPLFTGAFLDAWAPGRPIIALHTNGDGFNGDGAGGRGNITMLEERSYARGKTKARRGGHFGEAGSALLGDPDVYAIIPYRASTKPSKAQVACRASLNRKGINVWHERVGKSDGSLSNYVALNRSDIAYVNFEAQRDADLSAGAEAQRQMIDAYLESCQDLWLR